MRVHFVGIGGIGVSALAQYYLAKGHEVSGSDLVYSEITDSLKKKGVKVYIGKENLEDSAKRFDLVIYSPAINYGGETSIVKSYPETLGELTKKHFTIAVSGTSGKSTTTAMISLILIKAGFDPTVIIGTKLKEFGDSNCRVGNSEYLIIEADEHFGSFLNYWPKIIVITNIEADHLDYYKNLKNYILSFKKYIGHLQKEGILIVNNDDKNTREILGGRTSLGGSTSTYSLGQSEAEKLKKILKVPGEHNVYDALAALAVARSLKIPDKVSFKALSEYKGAWRRFEILQLKPFILVSDYGHNPAKAIAALKAAREKWPKKEIWCVYQPHQYQRTHYLFDEFVKIFRKAPTDKIIITDIYDVAGREEREIKKGISSQKLVEAVSRKNVMYLPNKEILPFLKKNFGQIEVLIIMGAGNIYKLCEYLLPKRSK
ncbi:MAG: UDP-N-acetylmuramate--L-alanine ligase [Candidatus Nealsonbacteria bacterium]|nr:UDP-N-acetylmuramate--L-alanine ligase [Candidatus Nealsonbacteria bacterium]